MTLAAPPLRFTPEDLLRMPDSSTLELVDGKLVEKNVSFESSRIEAIILLVIQMFLQKHKVAEALPARACSELPR